MTSNRKYETSLQVGDAVLIEALRLQSIGISVIPVTQNKRPAIKWKPFQSSPADESQVREWFDKRDDLGLAIILGAVSGNVVVRDFDIQEAWRRWAGECPKLEQMLPAVETSRGRHVYARISDCPAITREDGELRAKGQYVVCPPSVHPSGKRYFWLHGFSTLSDVPTLTLEQSGFDRCWAGDDPAPEPYLCHSDTESVSVPICVYLCHGTIPSAYGTRRHRLFELARRVRVHPKLATSTMAELKPLVEEWHRLALPNIRTKPFDETWSDFVEAHRNVDPTLCGDSAVAAMHRADAKALPPDALLYDSVIVRRLVGLCRELSSLSSAGDFFLSCREAARLLGTSEHKSVARWLQMLVADGVLIEVVKGGPHTNRASRYRWKGNR